MLSTFFNAKRPKFSKELYYPLLSTTTLLTSTTTTTTMKNYEKDYDGIKIFKIFNRPSNEIILPTLKTKTAYATTAQSLQLASKPIYYLSQESKKDICNLTQFTNRRAHSNYSYPFDYEYNNIWKLSFFVLAFIIGFISLFIILSFTVKYIITSVKKFRVFGHNTYQIHHAQSTQGSSKISTISLYESDLEKLSNNAYNFDGHDITFPPKSLDSLDKNRKHLKKHYFPDNQCIAFHNRAFINDNESPYDVGLCTSKTTFKPNDVDTKKKARSIITLTPLPSSSSTSSSSSTMSNIDLTKSNSNETITQHQWRQVNDYEALEIQPPAAHDSTTESSTISITPTTSTEKSNEIKSSFRQLLITKLEKRNSNNNEIIARSQKITQELETKLKERRLLMESQLIEEAINSKIDEQNNDDTEEDNRHSCECMCHACHEDRSLFSPINKETTKSTAVSKATYMHRQINQQLQIEQMEIILSKRESLRKLMQNKAVSGNKRRHELEKHLSSLLCSRTNNAYDLDT